jgi:endonuclease III-like uncharacterized protein
MTERAQRIYDAWEDEYCRQKPFYEHRALASAIREVVIEAVLSYMQYAEWKIVHKIMEDINELADELEAL